MQYDSLDRFMSEGLARLKSGPVGIFLMEDLSETNSTLRHHIKLGFKNLVVFGPPSLKISPELHDQIHFVFSDVFRDQTTTLVNRMIEACPGRWIYYGYNAEYLFYPFIETRSVSELTTFASEERRSSILTYVIDLYADDLSEAPSGVSLSNAHLDQSGYYAMSRQKDGVDLDRQMDMYGGLRWRFEEHVPADKRKIDRIGLFKAEKGLELRADHTFNRDEFNTYSCPWHHNLTAAICSFRAAKSLAGNPGSSEMIEGFKWHNSQQFAWHSRQLLDLGLIEPGQWV